MNRLLWFPPGVAPSVPLSLFTIASAIGWIWIPSVVLLSRQRSVAAVLLAALAAAMMASGLRKIIPAGTRERPLALLPGQWEERKLFDEYRNTPPREMHGLLIALCLYGALFAWRGKLFLPSSCLIALCAFMMSWKLRGDDTRASGDKDDQSRHTLRLLTAASTAILVTTGCSSCGS